MYQLSPTFEIRLEFEKFDIKKFDLIIVGLVNGDGSYEINPDPELRLSEDHTIMVMGQKGKLEHFKDSFPSHL